MSLIEKALGKVRRTATEAQPRVSQRPRLRAPENRTVLEPQLRITREMAANLGLMIGDVLEQQRSSEFRHIKRQVLAELRSNPGQHVVLIASALSGEGKSFTSANLARSLALEPDYTVLLVDGDAVKPHISRALGLVERPGLMNALADASYNVESLILTTDIEGLSVLPAGSASEQATEYFGSERMRSILAELQSNPSRIVVMDSLPILQTTEARALLPLASQVLLVVRADMTPQAAVQEALSVVGENVNVKLILNAVERTKLTRYLGFGYGYSYDYENSSKERQIP